MRIVLFGLAQSHFFSGTKEKDGPRLTFAEVLPHAIYSAQDFPFTPHNSSVRKASWVLFTDDQGQANSR